MTNIILMMVCLLVGMVLRKSGRLPDNAAASINGFIVHVSLPALILLHLHELQFTTEVIGMALMPWALFGFGLAFFLPLARALHGSRESTGGLILSSSLANTSFVGLPMIETFYGTAFIGVGILIDQLGTTWS